MGAIAEWRIVGVLAAAERCFTVAFHGELPGRELRSLVRAVAEGLRIRTSTGAVEILIVSHQIYGHWCAGGNRGFTHGLWRYLL